MEHGGLEWLVPVEWKMEFFNLCYGSNETGSPSVWRAARMEQRDLQCVIKVE